jgi:hypothetical protein
LTVNTFNDTVPSANGHPAFGPRWQIDFAVSLNGSLAGREYSNWGFFLNPRGTGSPGYLVLGR